MPGADPPTLHGIAACLALLEHEARTLDRPLAALLIAAAGEALHEAPTTHPTESSLAASPGKHEPDTDPHAQRRGVA